MSGSVKPGNDVFKKIQSTTSIINSNNKNSEEGSTFNLTKESIYEYYATMMYPAVVSSLPILIKKLAEDARDFVTAGTRKLVVFILPTWSHEHPNSSLPTLQQFWELASAHSPSELILRNFDTNGDGSISRAELLHMMEILKRMPHTPESWTAWFRREWPLMDWKIGVFLWRSFGGILFLLAFLSIVPGRLHGISAKILRWPVLGMTYFLIMVELVYVLLAVGLTISAKS